MKTKTNKSQHTPAQLKFPLQSSAVSAYMIQDSNGTNVIRIDNLNQQDCYKLEQLIVRAVNSYENLLSRDAYACTELTKLRNSHESLLKALKEAYMLLNRGHENIGPMNLGAVKNYLGRVIDQAEGKVE